MKLPFHLLGFVGPLSEKRGDRHGRSSNAQEASPSRSRGYSSSRSFSGDNRLLLFFEGDSRQRGSRPASTIRENACNGIHVENLTDEYVSTVEDVNQILMKGLPNRKVGTTSMNLKSSRSHIIFTCVIEAWSKIIWLKEFQKFDDNSSAINVGTGVNKQLTDMIMQWRRPGQKLVVGKPEYKSTIETFFGIPCLHDEVVMEVMWGMKRFMSNFVPAEESKLPKEDSLPMSQGLLMALLDVGHYLKRESGIDYENWDTLKLMFSDDVQSKLLDDADKYKDLVFLRDCLRLYENLVAAYNVRAVKKDELALLVKRANADEAEQARSITTII
uniref:Kinesin motor domain-containing protein n=1 Tax=Oryza glumipatula TaxID=40148 RepID=A0A0E0BKL2_9ORYZ